MPASNSSFEDHFSARAAGYAAFRPRYPAALSAWLATLTTRHELAWDAGTGNGQAATGLAAHYSRVLATDASEKQIAEAIRHEGIEYRVARERDSGLASATCDLVTAAQALHWFDIPAFFGEAMRVLRPGGALAVWTYARPELAHEDDAVLQEFVQLMDPWWPPGRALVESGYRGIALPLPEVTAPAFTLELPVSRAELAGYLRTWSAFQRYVAARGGDPAGDVEQRLQRSWPDGERRRLLWPLTVRAGKFESS